MRTYIGTPAHEQIDKLSVTNRHDSKEMPKTHFYKLFVEVLSAFLNGNAVYERQVYTADGDGWCALPHGFHINRISLAPIESRAIQRRYAPSHAHTHIYSTHLFH